MFEDAVFSVTDSVFLCYSAGWTPPRRSSGRPAVRAVSFSSCGGQGGVV